MIPYELVVKHVLPEIKGLIIHKLYSLGYSQLHIARLLGMSQSMVNKYLSTKIDKFTEKLMALGFSRDEIRGFVESLTSMLVEGNIAGFHMLMMNIVNHMLSTGRLCRLHKRLYKGLPDNCDVCMRVIVPGIIDPYIIQYEDVLNRIVKHPHSYKLVPEVGMNIVFSPPDAKDPSQYIAVPGRIVRVNNRVVPVGRPIRGGSRHTARILHLVKKYDPSKNVCITIRYEPLYRNILESMGLKIIDTGPHKSKEYFEEELEKELSRSGAKVIDVIADKGGMGLESIIYLFSTSLNELSDRIFMLLERI